MDWTALVVFSLALLVGSYFQAVTGFAMGMIAIAIVIGLNLAAIVTVTAAISLLSLLNVLLALKGRLGHVRGRFYAWLTLGQVPAIFAGVTLLGVLDAQAVWLLELLLGAFIVVGSLSMMIRPVPLNEASSPVACVAAGALGGMVGGLFSASGPVMGWFNYRQPFPVEQIRATLLCCFVVTTSVRTIVVGAAGGITSDVLALFAVGVPTVLVGTWLGRRYPPATSDQALRRLAFSMLFVMGAWVLLRGAMGVMPGAS